MEHQDVHFRNPRTTTMAFSSNDGAEGYGYNDFRHDTKHPKPSRNLIISPNLVAALEYEERVRAGPSEVPFPSTPMGKEGGLPPPPRAKTAGLGNKSNNLKTPQWSAAVEVSHAPSSFKPVHQLASCSPRNPYINRAPPLTQLQERFHENPLSHSVSAPNSPMCSAPLAHELVHSATYGGTPSPLELAEVGSGIEGGPRTIPGHRRFLSALPKVVLGRSKGLKNGDARENNQGMMKLDSVPATLPTLRFERPLTPYVTSTWTGAATAETKGGATGDSHEWGRWRARSASSAATTGERRGSADTNDSASSHEPPTTPSDSATRTISISSTIYPSDSDHHHSIDPDSHLHHSLPLGRSSMNTDRESFIELASPTFPPPDFSEQANASQHSRYALSNYTLNTKSTSAFKLPPPPKHKPPPPPPPTSKPPIPTSPKPVFARSRDSLSGRSASLDIPREGNEKEDFSRNVRNVPPTTNYLDPKERAERVRKTQKLTKVFGQNPGEAMRSQSPCDPFPPNGFLAAPNPATSGLLARRRHQKGAVSIAEEHPFASAEAAASRPRAVWPPPEGTLYMSLNSRRHSSPLSPTTFTFSDQSDISLKSTRDKKKRSAGKTRKAADAGLGSPSSFMDLSDEDVANDGASSIISTQTPNPPSSTTPRPPLSSTPSLLESISAEEERRRKRDKLAKLHRFLGSAVPVDLVLAQVDIVGPVASLPPISAVDLPMKQESEAHKAWLRRRRSSSAAEFSGTWSDEIDRLKEDLNDREKAINVRRAVKMEKMFGVAPPQTLYHTRQASVSSSPPTLRTSSPLSKQPSPLSDFQSYPPNVNTSAYSKSKTKKSTRPGTAESSQSMAPLISSGSHPSSSSPGHLLSEVYLHYRHSLNSLNDIIERDDKESLVDLHEYIYGASQSPPLENLTFQDSPLPPITPTTSKAERRRSLPTRTSLQSISSEFSLASPALPQTTTFQTRRRRVAKLANFFGVDYRVLTTEIIDSLEKGVEEERGRGTLQDDEVQDLLMKLRKLKVKRNTLFS